MNLLIFLGENTQYFYWEHFPLHLARSCDSEAIPGKGDY